MSSDRKFFRSWIRSYGCVIDYFKLFLNLRYIDRVRLKHNLIENISSNDNLHIFTPFIYNTHINPNYPKNRARVHSSLFKIMKEIFWCSTSQLRHLILWNGCYHSVFLFETNMHWKVPILHPQNSKARLSNRTDIVYIGPTMTFYYQ